MKSMNHYMFESFFKATATLCYLFTSFKLKPMQIFLQKEEDINSNWKIITSLCLMLVEFKRENKTKENPISAYLIYSEGL